MSDMSFHVSTKITDRSGMDQLTHWLADVEARANRIAKTMSGMSVGGFSSSQASGGGSASGGPPPRRPMQTGGGSGPSYDLNTQSGLYSWEVNVEKPVQQMAQAAQQTTATAIGAKSNKAAGGYRSEFAKSFMQTIAPSTMPRTKTTTVNPTAMESRNWFNGLAEQMLSPNISEDIKRAYFNTVGDVANSKATLPGPIKDFISQYGQQLGAPGPTTVSTTTPGNGFGTEAGLAIGSLAKRALPALTLTGAAMYTFDQFKQGYGLWQQSSAPVDQLAHSIGNAAKDVEKFRNQISYAGAQFGLSMQQSAQLALSFAQSMGGLSQRQSVALVGQTAQWAQQNGVTSTQAGQLTSTAAKLGLTSGVGASMSNQQFLNTISNMTSQGGMMGRQGEVGTAYLSVLNQIANTNPIVQNPGAIAGMLTAMNASGIQGLQGLRGASIAGQIANSTMNAQGSGQGIMMAAILKASGGKISNPLEMQYLLQQGPQVKIKGTNTTVGQAVQDYINGMSGNKYVQDYLGSMTFGVSMPQYQAVNGVKGLWSTHVSAQNGQAPWFSQYDWNSRVRNKYQVGQSDLGWFTSFGTNALQQFGPWGGIALAGLTAGTFMRGGMGLGGAAVKSAGGLFKGARGILGRLFAGGATDAAGGAAVDAGATAAGLGAADAGLVTGLEVGGTALDATGVGAVAGVPLQIIGALLAAGGIGMGVKGLMSNANHNAAHASHNNQVQSKISSSNRTIQNMTISNLTVSHLNMPGYNSMFASAASNLYAPTSGLNIPPGMPLSWAPKGGSGGGSEPNANWSGSTGTSNFVQTVFPYAEQVSKATGIPAQDLISQWGYESGGGTSMAAKQNYNLAGIKPFGNYKAGADSKYAGFKSLQDFANADIQVLNASRYATARAAAKGGASASVVGQLLASEGYATANPGQYGAGLQSWANAIAAAFEQVFKKYQSGKLQYLDPSGNPVTLGAVRP